MNIIEAVTKRKTVQGATINGNVLVVTFKPARQYSAECLCQRLQKAGFKAARRSRVLGVRVPTEQEQLQRLVQILTPRSNGNAEAAVQEIVAALQ